MPIETRTSSAVAENHPHALRALWESASPYLDRALDMTGEERDSFLTSLKQRDPGLAHVLLMLLDEHRLVSQERFLEETLPVEPQTALTGQRIGAYTLVSLIGQGGMGSVWLAERTDGRFERRVAIKLLNFSFAGGGGEQRFKR